MQDPNPKPQLPEADDALRERILARSQAINTGLIARLTTVADDLAQGRHRAVLGGLDGLERQIGTMRSFLLLLSEER
jgi:hypothetical protein